MRDAEHLAIDAPRLNTCRRLVTFSQVAKKPFVISGLVLAFLALVPSSSLQAACLTPPTVELRNLANLAETNPRSALSVINSHFRDLPASEVKSRVWLYVVKARALALMSNYDAVAQVATAGIKLDPNPRSLAHSELLLTLADVTDGKAVSGLLADVTRARAANAPRSPANICLQVGQGHLQYKLGMDGPSITNLMEAYRASTPADLLKQHVFAATYMSVDLGSFRDPQAVALYEEVLAWDKANGADYSIAADYYYIGALLGFSGRHLEALAALSQSRLLFAPFGDMIMDATINLEECENLVALKRYGEAQVACNKAIPVFAAAKHPSEAQAYTNLAEVALVHKNPHRALSILNGILASEASGSNWLTADRVYYLRSRAHAALDDSRQALADLNRYLDLYTRKNDTERARQMTVMRAELETDRTTARAHALQIRLALAAEHETVRSQQIMGIIAAASLTIIVLTAGIIIGARTRRRLRKVASTDALTGLLNRGSTVIRAQAALCRASDNGAPVSIAILDLDHFKSVNDTHGHAGGDEVLRRFAVAAETVLRGKDIVGRWGGEEFLVVLPDTTLDAAYDIIDRLRVFAEGIRLGFCPDLRIRFSAGLTGWSTGAGELEEIVAQADLALYEAKRCGRSRTVISREPLEELESPESRKRPAQRRSGGPATGEIETDRLVSTAS